MPRIAEGAAEMSPSLFDRREFISRNRISATSDALVPLLPVAALRKELA